MPHLWQSLPTGRLEQLAEDEKYRAIKNRIEDITRITSFVSAELPIKSELDAKQDVAGPESSAEEETTSANRSLSKLRRDLRTLEKKALVDYRASAGRHGADDNRYRACGIDLPFSRLCSVLPLRQQLSHLLLTRAKLRSQTGKAALSCLIALHGSHSEVQRPGLEKDRCLCKSTAQKT